MSPSSAPASPGCGPRTTCCAPTRAPRGGARARDGRLRCVGAQRRLVRRRPVRPARPSSSGRRARTRRARHGSGDAATGRRGRRVVADEDIDCGFAKGGALYVATNPSQLRRVRGLLDVHEQLRARRHLPAAVAARDHRRSSTRPACRAGCSTPTPPPSTRPGSSRGLAVAVERHGGVDPRADARRRRSSPGGCAPTTATCAPSIIVRGTEAYTRTLEGLPARRSSRSATT